MQKVKALSHSVSLSQKDRSKDLTQRPKNLNPILHPFDRAREYTRALNATKLERLFAKPFVGNLAGHIDGVYSLARHPTELGTIASGSGDGGNQIPLSILPFLFLSFHTMVRLPTFLIFHFFQPHVEEWMEERGKKPHDAYLLPSITFPFFHLYLGSGSMNDFRDSSLESIISKNEMVPTSSSFLHSRSDNLSIL